MRRRAASVAQRKQGRPSGLSATLRSLATPFPSGLRTLPRSAIAAFGLFAVLAAIGVVTVPAIVPLLQQQWSNVSESSVIPHTVARNANAVGSREILVTRRLVHSGEPLTPDLVSFASRAPTDIPPDAVVELEDIAGRVALAPIPSGYPVTDSALGRPVVILNSQTQEAPSPSHEAGGAN